MPTPTSRIFADIRVTPSQKRPNPSKVARLPTRFKLDLCDAEINPDNPEVLRSFIIDCRTPAAARYVRKLLHTVFMGLDGVRLKADAPAVTDESYQVERAS